MASRMATYKTYIIEIDRREKIIIKLLSYDYVCMFGMYMTQGLFKRSLYITYCL